VIRLLFFALALTLGLALTAPLRATAGTLTKADVEALFPPPQLVGERLAHLPVWPIFVRTGQGPVLQNHVFETIDLEPVAGYGGKPINMLVVLDRDGAFVMTRLVSHTEPIFRSAEGNALLDRFGQQYQGITVNHNVHVLGAKAQRAVTPTTATLHGIVAGTVTALAINRSIMESAAQVAQMPQAAHDDPAAASRADKTAREAGSDAAGPDDRYQRTGFNGLAAAGLVQHWSVINRAVEGAFAGTAGAGRDAEGVIRPNTAAVDLWLAFVGIPQAGRNLLAAPRWREVRALREAGRSVLLVQDGSRYALHGAGGVGGSAGASTGASTGASGAPGSSAAPGAPSPVDAPAAQRLRGGALTLVQAGREFTLVELPWTAGLRVSGQHSGVSAGAVARYYEVRPAADGTALDVFKPVQMSLAIWRRTAQGDAATVRLERAFTLPEADAWRPERETPRWLAVWAQRSADLAVLAVALALLTAALIWQRRSAANRRRLLMLRLAFLVFTLGFIGWWAQGQLTVVSLTAMVEALVAGRNLEFLLLDPMAVVLWAFTLVTLFVWGRGTFCGWLCPFGALQELVARLSAWGSRWQRPGRPKLLRRLPAGMDRRLKHLKYVVLAVLLGAAALSPTSAEWLVEVEPFKTSISLYFQRSWPYLAWALLCIGVGIVVYRGFCRYLCPLGAALALLARTRRWAWIPRRTECGTPCQTCRHRCDYQAIAADGRVDYAECFQCLDCVQIHDDRSACLPLVAQARGKVIPIRVAVG
jgi:NosR/NirI family transcriptional regulator, nitrous oxide reductase regulator